MARSGNSVADIGLGDPKRLQFVANRIPGTVGGLGSKSSETVEQVFQHHRTGNNAARGKVDVALGKDSKPSGGFRIVVRYIVHGRTVVAWSAAFQFNFRCGLTGRVRSDFDAIGDDVFDLERLCSDGALVGDPICKTGETRGVTRQPGTAATKLDMFPILIYH